MFDFGSVNAALRELIRRLCHTQTTLQYASFQLTNSKKTSRLGGSEEAALDVFLSSTFFDMQRERDILARLVFPRLRAHFSDRCVVLREVDLRWGVTETMARDGGAVGVCLDAIAAAFPLIIGLVGWRSGWRPPQEAIAHFVSKLAGEHGCDLSMTEMELRYAVSLARTIMGAPPITVFLRDKRLSEELGGVDADPSAITNIRMWLAQQPQVRIIPYSSFEAFEREAEAALRQTLEAYLAGPPIDVGSIRQSMVDDRRVERPDVDFLAIRDIGGARLLRWPADHDTTDARAETNSRIRAAGAADPAGPWAYVLDHGGEQIRIGVGHAATSTAVGSAGGKRGAVQRAGIAVSATNVVDIAGHFLRRLALEVGEQAAVPGGQALHHRVDVMGETVPMRDMAGSRRFDREVRSAALDPVSHRHGI